MEKDINIKINGLSKSECLKVVDSLKLIIDQLSFLDMRRLTNILVTSTFQNDVSLLTIENKDLSQNRFKVENNTFAIVLTLPKKEDFELFLVIDSSLVLNLLKDKDNIEYKNAFHILHHEFAHIHDNNKKIDIFKDMMKNKTYKGLNSIIFPIAETCWSEYIANFISSKSAIYTDYPLALAKSLVYKVKKVNQDVKNQLLAFQINPKREDLVKLSIDQVKSLLKNASYLIGYLHGLNISLEQLDDESALELEKIGFIEVLYRMMYELNSIHQVYPNGFVNTSIYNNLASLIIEFYQNMGIGFFEEDNTLKIGVL